MNEVDTKNILDTFTAWAPLFKARKAKGLDQWERLKGISGILQGKDSKAISFTCAHPSHSGEPIKHLLGSIEGNLHFLMGYGNPRFHFAPYHVLIMDPSLTQEEAAEIATKMAHPSNPKLWAKLGIQVGDEGDTTDGEVHPQGKQDKIKESKDQQRAQEAIPVSTPTGKYTAYPSEGVIVGDHNNHVYRWDLAQDTFFSASNPKVALAMNEASVVKSIDGYTYKDSVPERVQEYASAYLGKSFNHYLWPLVKDKISKPGSVIKLHTDTSETIYGVVTPSFIEFYGRDANPVGITVFDQTYKSLDLCRDCTTPPSVLLSFLTEHLGVNTALLQEAVEGAVEYKSMSTAVEGEPTVGFDHLSADNIEYLNKSIETDGETIRLVIQL